MRTKLTLPITLAALALGLIAAPSQAAPGSETANLGIAGNVERAQYDGWHGYRHWDRRHYRHSYRYYRHGDYGYRRHRRHYYYWD